MENLLPLLGPALVAAVVSIITALFLRRTSRESNETNAFKVVTDQLFALNKTLQEEQIQQAAEIRALRKADSDKEQRIERLEEELDISKKVARALARYIGVLIQRWPGDSPPPPPEPPIDWEKHL